jgi:tRNA pseudouridine38-40 synthase
MVRNIVGTLVDVGMGNISPEEFHDILISKDRKKAGKTAPPQGLFLRGVKYRSHPTSGG